MFLRCREIQNRSHNTQSRAQAGLLRSGDSGFRIPVCRAKPAHTNRRLDKALSRREEADRLKGMAIRQAAAASGRVAVIEQHGVMFAEQVGEDAGGYGSGLRLPACQSSSAPAVPGSTPKLGSCGRSRRLRLSSANPGKLARPVT